MSISDLLAKWEARAQQLEQFRAQVDGAKLCREVLQDFAELRHGEADELLTLRQAAAISGYSADHLGRLVRAGTIPNAGRHGAPRIRRGELPHRAGALPSHRAHPQFGTTSKTQIARSIVNAERKGAR